MCGNYDFHMNYIFAFLVFSFTPQLLADVRDWTNKEGTVISAELVKVENGVVELKKDGKLYQVPLAQLSQADQDHLAAQQAVKTPETKPEEPKAETPSKPATPRPVDLSTWIAGDKLDEAALSALPLVIHPWEAHCGRCPASLADFQALARKKKRHANFMIWHMRDKEELAEEKSRELNLRLPVYHGKGISWDAKKHGPMVWPHVILLDKAGVEIYRGAQGREFEKALKTLSSGP